MSVHALFQPPRPTDLILQKRRESVRFRAKLSVLFVLDFKVRLYRAVVRAVSGAAAIGIRTGRLLCLLLRLIDLAKHIVGHLGQL